MGLISEGTPLSWQETRKYAGHVREHGAAQFVNVYKKFRNLKNEEFLWGDEVEYMIVKLDPETKTARLSLRATELLKDLQSAEKESPDDCPSLWRQEFGSYMVESSPGKPYGDLMKFVNVVEDNMRLRRKELKEFLHKNEYPLTLSAFPRNGCASFTDPQATPTPYSGYYRSLFIPDEAMQQMHSRYKILITENVRHRRGGKVAINIPIFKDTNTPRPFIEDLSLHGDKGDSQRMAIPDQIYMDCSGFAFGGCCVQTTFQTSCLEEAMMIHDQLMALSPVLIALSAATPVYRGYLSDHDTRSLAMSQGMDDRTEEERGLKPLKENQVLLNKSLCDAAETYLHYPDFSDIDIAFDKDIHQTLTNEGIDDLLAKYMAHVFYRGPLMILKEHLHHNDEEDTLHVDNIMSSTWKYVKLKLPSEDSDAGWRLEFRPIEAQLTDFENAAYVVFMALLVQAICSLRLNFVIPLSMVGENLQKSYKRDAVTESKFCFRNCVLSDPCNSTDSEMVSGESTCNTGNSFEELTINEIINGKSDGGFPGLIPLINRYVDQKHPDHETRSTIQRYLNLISARASGQLKTTSRWMRDFVTSHPDYKHDSVVPDSVNYDLMLTCAKVSSEQIMVPELLPIDKNISDGNTIPTMI